MFFKQFVNNKPEGFLISEENLRQVLLSLDFDKNPPPGVFELNGYTVVIPTDKPKVTPYQTIQEVDCVKNSAGFWEQKWEISDLPKEECDVIFANQLAKVKGWQDHLLEVYAQQLADPAEPPEEIIIINKWIQATKLVDLSDPFNVKWPTSQDIL